MLNHFKALRLLFVVAVATVALSCSSPEPYVVYGLTLSQSSVVFNAEGGSQVVGVTPFPAEEPWMLDVKLPEWVSVEAVEAGVSVAVEPNSSTEVRTTSFAVISPQGRFDDYIVTISQEGAEEATFDFVCSAEEGYTFDSEGGSRTFTVISEADWSVECDCDWLQMEVSYEEGIVTLTAQPNELEVQREATLYLNSHVGRWEVAVVQQTKAENPYYKLVGRWEITASKWFYSPNGSLNSLDYAPNASDYFLIFDIEEGKYGETLVMRNFLYPNTALEVKYDASTGGFVIPFGWTVLSYDVFFYVTLVSDRQFSYASLEVDVLPSSDGAMLTPQLPAVDGYNWVGFGLWTYDDNESKVALGSNYRPTMFPMGDVVFRKYEE